MDPASETTVPVGASRHRLWKFVVVEHMAVLIALMLWAGRHFVERMEKWVLLDKEIFGFGQAPGNFLPSTYVDTMLRLQQFANPVPLTLCWLLLMLVACGPFLILAGKQKWALGWGWLCLVMIASSLGLGYIGHQAYRTPHEIFAREYKLAEAPRFSRRATYMERLTDPQNDVDTANGYVGMLGWFEECSRFGLNRRPLETRDRLAEFAGDENQAPLSRLLAAAAVLRMLDPQELEERLHFEPMKLAAESARDLEGDTVFLLLRNVGRPTGADVGGALAFE